MSRLGHGTPGAVTVHSQGGLGNQLFIYAAGLAAATAQGVALRVDNGLHDHDPARPYLLAELGLAADHVTLKVPAASRAERLLGSRRDVPHGCSYREPSFRYDPSVLAQPTGGCMFGYFQSWQYLEPVALALRRQLGTLSARLSTSAAKVAEDIEATDGIVLHVRRGDYLRPQAHAFHGLVESDYYGRAVHILRRMGRGGPLHVFSDDPAGAEELLSPFGDVRIVSTESARDWEEMLLMSAAPALVTANSSFSWWAGWLGDREGRTVISPRPWFDDVEHDSRDLLPHSWLTLGRSSHAAAAR